MQDAERWASSARPRLASKVRLQWNEARGQALLLFPEGALVLNPTAQAVLELCDGQRTIGEIVSELARRFDRPAGATAESVQLSTDPGTSSASTPGDSRERTLPGGGPERFDVEAALPAERQATVERDVRTFLRRLDQRGWIVDAAAPAEGHAR